MCNGFPARKMEQMIITSLCDVMRISHARKGRELYKESMTNLRAVVTVIWVSGTRHLGSLTSHRPSTSAVLVLLEEEA